MPRIFSKFFRRSRSSSSKRSSHHASQTSVNDNQSERSADSSGFMRSAVSQPNIHQFIVIDKELSKHKLHRAAYDGNMSKVKELAHPNLINKQDQRGRTPLVYAIAAGKVDIVRFLIHEGAKTDTVDDEKHTPLMNSILHPHQDAELDYEIQTILLTDGAQSMINHTDTHQRTALHYAVEIGNERAVGQLLRVQRIDPNIRDIHRATPLHLAAVGGHHRIVQMLLNSSLGNRCDPNLRDNQNMTAYDRAVQNGQQSCIRILENYVTTSETASQRSTGAKTSSIHTGSINPNSMSTRAQNPKYDDDSDESDTETPSEGQVRVAIDNSSDGESQQSLPKPGTSAAMGLLGINPIQPASTIKRNPTDSSSSVLANFANANPIKPNNETTTKPKTTVNFSQPSNAPSLLPTQDNTNSSLSLSVDKSIVNANPLAGPTSNTNKHSTINNLLNSLPHPERNESSLNSWSIDGQKSDQGITAMKPAQRTPSSNDSTDHDDTDQDDIGLVIQQPKTPPVQFQQTQTFQFLNTSSVFTTNQSDNRQKNDAFIDDDDEDSIEAAVQPRSTTFPDNYTNTANIPPRRTNQITQPNINEALTPVSPDESSWSESAAKINRQSNNAAISSLVHQQPLINKRSLGSNLDDSRPLSTDLHNNSSAQEGSYSDSNDASSDEDSNVQILLNPPSTVDPPRVLSSLLTSSIPRKELKRTEIDSNNVANWNRPPNPAKPSATQNSVLSSLVSTNLHKSSQHSIETPGNDLTNTNPSTVQNSTLAGLVNKNIHHDKPNSGENSGNNVPNINRSPKPVSPSVATSSTIDNLVIKSVNPGGKIFAGPNQNNFDNRNRPTNAVNSPDVPNNTISHIVNRNLQQNGTHSTENAAATIESLVKRNPIVERRSSSSSNTGRIVVSPMPERDNDSISTNSGSSTDDATNSIDQRKGKRIANSFYDHDNDEVQYQNWSRIGNEGEDFKYLTGYSNGNIQADSRMLTRTPLHRDPNRLRNSMSSSTSSMQDSMHQLSQIKEDLNKIERKQEDQIELKRQLRDMEIKKNNFEALYKKHDELLRSTEAKLEKETNEKQRFEWNSKTLTMELKTIREKLKSLEDEKELLNQRCVKLKEERDNFDERWRVHQTNHLQATTATLLREEDIEKIKLRHREEMKLLSNENDELHQRTKQLQSDLQLHKESLDVTIRYKIDLENAVQEKNFLQHELDRLKHEKEVIEQEKIDYRKRYDALEEEIRQMLTERTKIEQKLTNELQEQIKQRQRTTDDVKKYKSQIEQLNLKLGEAEARLLVLQTQNEALLASKDREIKSEFETLTQRLNQIEAEKTNAEQRYQNEKKELVNKSTTSNNDPLAAIASTPLTNPVQNHQQSLNSSACSKCDNLQRTFEKEREQRMQIEQDNDKLRNVLTRQRQQQDDLNRSLQQQHQENEQMRVENSKERRTETERFQRELDRLRQELNDLVLSHEPSSNIQQQKEKLHSKIENMRQLFENEYTQRSRNLYSTSSENIPRMYVNRPDFHHNTSNNCVHCFNSRLLKERLENAIDTSLAEQRIQTIKQMKYFPRATDHNMTTTVVTGGFGTRRSRNYL